MVINKVQGSAVFVISMRTSEIVISLPNKRTSFSIASSLSKFLDLIDVKIKKEAS